MIFMDNSVVLVVVVAVSLNRESIFVWQVSGRLPSKIWLCGVDTGFVNI